MAAVSAYCAHSPRCETSDCWVSATPSMSCGTGHVDAAEQDHERRAAADDEGVDEHRQRLRDALADRMAHVRRGRDVGCRAESGLVREQATAQPLRQCGAHAAADGFLEAEGIREDRAEHARQLADVHHDDQQRQQDVADGHHRHDHVGHLGDAVDAAIDDEAGADRQQDAGPQAFDAEAVERGAGHGVALEGVEAQCKGGDQADRVQRWPASDSRRPGHR